MNIDRIVSDSLEYRKNGSDQAEKTEKRGRKNKGLTELHKQEYNELKKQEYRMFSNIEHCNGEIVNIEDLKEFKEVYQTTCNDVLMEFNKNNEELVKKHPNMWYKRLLLDLKRNTPNIKIDNVDKLIAVWDCIRDLLNYIGLYMTYEAFRKITDIEKKSLESRKELSPKYADFLQKIYNDCKDDLQMEIYYSPLNSVTKIYMNKAVYGVIEKTEQKTIEVNHTIRNYDTLPMYSNNFIEDHQQQNI